MNTLNGLSEAGAVIVVALGFMTLIVIIIGVPLTLIAYRDRLRRM